MQQNFWPKVDSHRFQSHREDDRVATATDKTINSSDIDRQVENRSDTSLKHVCLDSKHTCFRDVSERFSTCRCPISRSWWLRRDHPWQSSLRMWSKISSFDFYYDRVWPLLRLNGVPRDALLTGFLFPSWRDIVLFSYSILFLVFF